MKRAWFQRIRGGGCQTLVYGEKTHVLPPCVVCPPFLFHQPLQWLGFVCWGQLWLVVEVVIAFGSGVAGLSVPCSHAHSTHDCIHSMLGLHLLHDAIFFPFGSLSRGGRFISSHSWYFPSRLWSVRSLHGRFFLTLVDRFTHTGWDPHVERHSIHPHALVTGLLWLCTQ